MAVSFVSVLLLIFLYLLDAESNADSNGCELSNPQPEHLRDIDHLDGVSGLILTSGTELARLPGREASSVLLVHREHATALGADECLSLVGNVQKTIEDHLGDTVTK